jgi:Family of unknown function (DUF6361)
VESTFTWLDFSERERRRMVDLIDQFREKSTLDELGFAPIRDAFSDYFFPGVTTIQTRARYLLFVPWIYRAIERGPQRLVDYEAEARRDFARLVRALLKGGEGDAQGVIGIVAGEALLRTPDYIYWTALGRFGLWRYPGAMSQYLAAVKRDPGAAIAMRGEDGQLAEEAHIVGWDPELPDPPTDLLQKTTFALSKKEADYMGERINSAASGSMLALCLEGSKRLRDIKFPWEHPDLHRFPAELKRVLEHARLSSLVSQGASLLYNLMLAEKATAAGLAVESNLVDALRNELAQWAGAVTKDRVALQRWSIPELWAVTAERGHFIGPSTRQFWGRIVDLVREGGFADDAEARSLITRRELRLKGGLARLTHRRPLERFWGRVGIGQQSYRWDPNARRIIIDIHAGLGLGPNQMA